MYTGGHKIVIDGFDGQTYTATLENRVDALEGVWRLTVGDSSYLVTLPFLRGLGSVDMFSNVG